MGSVISPIGQVAQLGSAFNAKGGATPSGGLSAAQSALSQFSLGQSEARTRDIYGRLGLGGSTMEAQDLGGNQLASLAQTASLEQQNIQNQQQAFQNQIALSNLFGNIGKSASAGAGASAANTGFTSQPSTG